MPQPPKNTREFQALVEVVEALRGPNGCPWDKEQTHSTLTQFAIEEAHELADAIDSGEQKEITEELGDLLLQVVLHSEIAKQSGTFTLQDVIESITTKMIRRHPHVFSDVKVSGIDEVWSNWNKIKADESAAKANASPFASIPKQLPSLLRAMKIGHKTRKFKFDWENPEQVLEKIKEELGEFTEVFEAAKAAGKLKTSGETESGEGQSPFHKDMQHELGDMLFSIAQMARHLGLDAEQSLRLCNTRFETRFLKMQSLAQESNSQLETLPPSELESLWQKAKKFDNV